MTRRKVCWSDLPAALLTSIYERLGCQLDTLNFKLVCKVWLNSSTPSSHQPLNLLSSIFPMKFDLHSKDLWNGFGLVNPELLIVPCSVFVVQSSVKSILRAWVCNIGEFCPGKFHVRRPPHAKYLSSDIQENFGSLYHRVKQVGRFYTLGDRYFTSLNGNHSKVVLIADPNRQTVCPRVYDYNAIMLNSEGLLQLINIEHGSIKTITDCCYNRKYDDVVNFNGNVYVIDREGKAYTVDYNLERLDRVVSEGVSSGLKYDRKKRVAVSSSTGELYLVRRSTSRMKCRFKFYKLNEMKNKWDEVKEIGADRILIVTPDLCFFAMTTDFLGWRGNSMVFYRGDFPDYACDSHDTKSDFEIFGEKNYSKIDVGVFNFEDGECKRARKRSCLF